jgi:hypothetical protein
VLYSMTNENLSDKVSWMKVIVARWRYNSLNLTWFTLLVSIMDIRLKLMSQQVSQVFKKRL